MNSLLIAANAAPVGIGTFPCMELTIIQDKALMIQIESAVTTAMPQMPNKHPLYNAPTCILVSVKKEEGMPAAMHQLSASCIMEDILIEASDLGLGSTYLMGAPAVMANVPDLCKAAKVPEGFAPIAMAAVCYSIAEVAKKEPTIEKLACARV